MAPFLFSLQDKKLSLTGHIPGKDFPYSDHEGVEATFVLEQRENALGVEERVMDGVYVSICSWIQSNFVRLSCMIKVTVFVQETETYNLSHTNTRARAHTHTHTHSFTSIQ